MTSQFQSPPFYRLGCDWLHLHAYRHLPAGVGTYKVRMFRNALIKHPDLGCLVEPPVLQGQLIEIAERYAVLQESPDCFTVLDRVLLGQTPPALESTIRIKPYQARDFDGHSLYSDPGLKEGEMLIGKRTCIIPVDVASDYLVALKHQLEAMPMPDRLRTMAEALVDAGAKRDNISVVEDANNQDYTFNFQVSTQVFAGQLAVGYSIMSDLYWIKATPVNGDPEVLRSDVYFDCLASTLADFIDDDQWQAAEVSVL